MHQADMMAIADSRSPCRERGLKCFARCLVVLVVSRSPCRERGLKWNREREDHASETSLPVQGAWIEMPLAFGGVTRCRGRSPCRERGLKWRVDIDADMSHLSLPVQGAWIEIPAQSTRSCSSRVAPRAGSVD